MNIRIVENMPFSEYENLLTNIKYEWIKNAWNTIDRVVNIAVLDDDEDETVHGYCVFVTQKYSSETAILLYVFVEEEYRRQGIATEMMRQGLMQLRDWGYKSTALSVLNDLPMSPFEKAGFRLLRTEHHMVYYGKILLESKVGKDLDKMAPYRQFVKKEAGITSIEKRRFHEAVLGSKLHVDLNEMDPHLTRYFVDKNQHIIACMPICMDAIGNIIILDLFIERVKESQMAIPCMMVDLLTEQKNAGKLKDDTRITISLTSEQNIQAMSQAFGEPKRIIIDNVMIC